MSTGLLTDASRFETSHGPAPVPLDGALALLERAVAYTRVQLQVVTPPMLCLLTPCTTWSLAALLDHMVESLDSLVAGAGLGDGVQSTAAVPPVSAVGAVERLRASACALLGAWSAATDGVVAPDETSVLACAGALEVAVHGWDVSQTTGTCEPIPAVLARDLLIWADVLVSDADRPARFDHPVRGPSVGPSSKLLRMLGREP
jgi:uncharacterized protein (TIGR03086 family)